MAFNEAKFLTGVQIHWQVKERKYQKRDVRSVKKVQLEFVCIWEGGQLPCPGWPGLGGGHVITISREEFVGN